MGDEKIYYELLLSSLKFFVFGIFVGILMGCFWLSLIIVLDYYEKYWDENVKSMNLVFELFKLKLEVI